jgi:hypothetical protein
MARLLRPGWFLLTLAILAVAAIRFALGADEPAYDPAQAVEAPAVSDDLPPQLPPTGGPYLETSRVMDLALAEAAGRQVEDPRIQNVLFMTYADAVRRIGSGSVTSVSPDREVYVVSLAGNVALSRHGQQVGSFARTVCIFDASTGDLLGWAATNRPDRGEEAGGRSPAQN